MRTLLMKRPWPKVKKNCIHYINVSWNEKKLLNPIISIIESFWNPYKKPNVKMQNPFNSQYKSIDILLLYVTHNK
jgi:hypothetical protein